MKRNPAGAGQMDFLRSRQGLVGLVEITTFLELCLEIARR